MLGILSFLLLWLSGTAFAADNKQALTGQEIINKEMGTFTNQITRHGEDQTDVDSYFETSDFRKADGVKLPYRFEQVVAFPIIRQKKAGTIVGTIKEYRHNVPIDSKMLQ